MRTKFVPSWTTETDLRPAPLFLGFASSLVLTVAMISSIKSLYGIAAMFGFHAIQLTIWRAAVMIAKGGMEITTENRERLLEKARSNYYVRHAVRPDRSVSDDELLKYL